MNLVWLDISASYSHASLALPAIEACRRDDNYKWSKISGTINSDVYLLTKELYEATPTIVAATLWLFNHEVTIKVCQRLKALLPHTTIILGGPEFNGNNESFLRHNSFINFAFRGEGESEFHRFIAGEPHSSITGLCYIDNNGNYVDNGVARVADFASLPAPESSQFFQTSSPFVQLECSRGCFNSCAFCVSGGDKPIRTKPIAEIKERIDAIWKMGIKDIRILDRTFNYSTSRASEMLELFTKYPSMNFHLEIHPALLSDSLCDLLRSMPKGVLHLEAGMQSLDDKVIEASNRIGTNENAIKGLSKLCAMTNFETHADLIAGLPHYSLEQIFTDIQRLSIIGAGEIQLELLKLLPGTKMRREASSLGIKYALTPPYEVLETPAITISELDRARLLSKLVDKFYNAKGWQEVTRKIINENDNFLPTLLNYLAATDILEKPLSLEKRGSLLYHFCKDHLDNRYTDMISIAWIENGMSLRKEEAGNITKAKTLPEGVERQNNVHYYLWQGDKKSYIFAFDRSKDHSSPTAKYEVTCSQERL
ncbi:MAG: DUF4080 domain-containing protein [Rikenellaceae bacterium]